MTAARASVLPLVRRFQVGEGVLLAINASLLLVRPGSRPFSRFVLSIVVLAVMYALNDWWDARRDMDNPRKDRVLASYLHEHRLSFAAVLAMIHFAAILCGAALGVGMVTAAVLFVNAIYSFVFKGIPVLDVVLVGVWGAAFAALVGRDLGDFAVLVVVGAMTAASHVFQAMGDRLADLRAGVATSAASRKLGLVVLAAACFVLVWGLRPLVGPLSFVGLAPLGCALLFERSLVAWMASKLAFGLVWLLVLWNLHGAG